MRRSSSYPTFLTSASSLDRSSNHFTRFEHTHRYVQRRVPGRPSLSGSFHTSCDSLAVSKHLNSHQSRSSLRTCPTLPWSLDKDKVRVSAASMHSRVVGVSPFPARGEDRRCPTSQRLSTLPRVSQCQCQCTGVRPMMAGWTVLSPRVLGFGTPDLDSRNLFTSSSPTPLSPPHRRYRCQCTITLVRVTFRRPILYLSRTHTVASSVFFLFNEIQISSAKKHPTQAARDNPNLIKNWGFSNFCCVGSIGKPRTVL